MVACILPLWVLDAHNRWTGIKAPCHERLHVNHGPTENWMTVSNFDIAWGLLEGLGLPLRDKAEAWETLQTLRNSYGSQLQDLMDFLVAPRGFWGHSAEETVA